MRNIHFKIFNYMRTDLYPWKENPSILLRLQTASQLNIIFCYIK